MIITDKNGKAPHALEIKMKQHETQNNHWSRIQHMKEIKRRIKDEYKSNKTGTNQTEKCTNFKSTNFCELLF